MAKDSVRTRGLGVRRGADGKGAEVGVQSWSAVESLWACLQSLL